MIRFIKAALILATLTPYSYAQSPQGEGNKSRVLIISDKVGREFDPLSVVRKKIESAGGRVSARIGHAGMIAEIELATVPDLVEMPGVAGIYDSSVTTPPFDDVQTLNAVTAWNFILTPPDPSSPDPQNAPPSDVFQAPEEFQIQSMQSSGCCSNGASFNDTSLYWVGDIAVGVFYTTSGWTAASAATSFAAVVSTIENFRASDPNVRMGVFTYISEVDAVTGNPLTKPSNERQYDNNLRTTWCTDWAYLIEIRNDNTWPNAFMYGPSLRLDKSWYPYDPVVIHETGHIFGAGDQYCNWTPNVRYGYLMATHGNACGNDGTGYFGGAGENLPDIMSGWDGCYGYNKIISVFTAGQLGWYDHDADGILDIMDTQPKIDKLSVTHTSGNQPIYSGIAFDSPLLSELSSGSVSVNHITDVQYCVIKSHDPCNNLAWQDAGALDLSFDCVSENFVFQTPLLPNGTYTVLIRAKNSVGAFAIPYSEQLVITGSTTTNTRPFGVLSVTPARAQAGTTVVADASASRDIETATGLLEYSWKWNDPSAPSNWTVYNANPTASHVYANPGNYLVEMRVRDTGSPRLFHYLNRKIEATNFDTAPIAAFRATPENRHFITGPSYYVGLSPIGTSDAEDSFASLMVRWDADGDGTYEIPWGLATPKTVSLPTRQLMFPPSCVLAPVYPRSDRRVVRMQVMDTAGNVSTAERVIWVVPYNHRPTLNSIFNPITFVANGSNWNATVHASDADFTKTWDGILEYRWDFDGDGIWDTPFGPSATMTVPSKTTLRAEVQDRFQARVIATSNFLQMPPAWPCAVLTHF